MATRQLSDGNPDGQVLGQSATDKVSFYGATPVVQQTLSNTLTSASTSTDIGNAVTEIQAFLATLGLTA